MTPTTGRIVLYRLTEVEAEVINRRREAAVLPRKLIEATGSQLGVSLPIGNPVTEGDEVPLVIARVWPNDTQGVNGQAVLDGNDTLWVTCAREGTVPGTWHWPERVT